MFTTLEKTTAFYNNSSVLQKENSSFIKVYI